MPDTLGTVILVPGIGGNELSTNPTLFGLGPPVRLWMSPGILLVGGWRLLGLRPNGITPTVPLTDELTPGLSLSGYYDNLGEMLSGFGWRVVSARLDWRQTIQRDAARLVELIRRESVERPVHLVCHSRGGLVARAAMGILGQTSEYGRLGWSCGLGVPHQGSWEAAGLLAGWNATARLLQKLLGEEGELLAGFSVYPTFRDVIITWPAAYQLLVNPSAVEISPNEAAAIYDPETWSRAGLPVSEQWLGFARTAWSILPPIPPQVSWADFVGVGSRTPTRLYIPAEIATSEGWLWTYQGDGVVPAAWAVQPGRPRVTCPTSHGALVYDGRVVAVIDTVLRGSLTGNVVIEGPLLQ